MKTSHRPIALLFLPLLVVFGSGCFRVSRDTAVLRDAVIENSSGSWDEKIEFGVGRLTFAAAQFGSRYVDLPDEARVVLGAASAGEVGVYECHGARTADDRAKMLTEADEKLAKRGWDRLVGVMQDDQLVAVYVPSDVKSLRSMKVCVLVLNGSQLVCASARASIEPLLGLALEKAELQLPPRPRDGRVALAEDFERLER